MAEGIVLDFNAKCKKFENVKPISDRSTITVRIYHANTFTRKYTVRGVATDLHGQAVPGPLKDMFLKSAVQVAGLNAQNVESPIAKSRLSKMEESFASAVEKWGEAWGEFETLAKKETGLGNMVNLDTALDCIAFNDAVDNLGVQSEMAKETRKILAGENDPEGLLNNPSYQARDPLELLKEKLTDPVKERVEKLAEYFGSLDKAYTKVESEYMNLLLKPDPDPAKQAERVKQADIILTEVRLRQAQAVEDRMVANASMVKIQAKVENAEKYLKAAEAAVKREGFILGPLEASGDQYTVYVVATPTKAFLEHQGLADPATAAAIETPVRLDVYGRQVLDFTLGQVFTGLKDRNYHKDSLDVVQKGINAGSDFQSAALAHWYRTPRPNNVAFGLTLGTTLDADRPRILLGGSAIYGSATRVVLSFGLAMGDVTRLNGMRVGQNIGDLDLDTASVRRTSIFAGLSFNFISR